MSNDTEFMDVMVPVKLENGKTIWTKIGTGFPNRDPNKNHEMVLSITSIPLGMFNKDEIKIFIFPQRKPQQHFNNQSLPSSHIDVDDVLF